MGRRTLHVSVNSPAHPPSFRVGLVKLNSVLRRADYADDEYIRELMAWPHPHAASAEAFEYTEKENLVMLRLPRKECAPVPNSTRRRRRF